MFRPVFRYFPARFLLLATSLAVALFAAPADSLRSVVSPRTADSLRKVDSVRAVKRSLHEAAPDSSYRWPRHARIRVCADPLESVGHCWRDEPLWAVQETGFPGLRDGALDLGSLDPLRVSPFYSGAGAASPYRTGGLLPFQHFEGTGNTVGGVGPEEVWLPVQPLDTPTTELHWTRGALFLNQFTLRMERMVGNRAYLGLEYHSDGAEKQDYQYAFQVHQPYLGALNRDSLSLVIADTSNAISARHIRPRLGFWLSSRDVVEFYGDFVTNKTSLSNPGNPMTRDSTQLLYPAAFGSATFGLVAAHAGSTHAVQALFRHASWERTLSPRLTSRVEDASGTSEFGRLDWTLPGIFGNPRVRLEAQTNATAKGWYTAVVSDSLGPRSRTRDDLERLELSARPALGPFTLDLRGDGARRRRADDRVEWLGGAAAAATLDLPLGLQVNGGAGRSREGAPDDLLFRWQPALGLYPNPALTPRTATHYGAGAGWNSRHLGFGAAWDEHRFENTWLPRVLPKAFASDNPDSIALQQTAYPEESRTLLHLSAYGTAGNWRLSLWNTSLMRNIVRDHDSATGDRLNRTIPKQVVKGQLLWKRRILDDKLGLQTQWDWEWFSERYAWASDMNGSSRLLKLDEYVVLDFTAQMEIRTFLLYFRAMNLNHDRYATEPGVHPPGVNFRFGVDWRLGN
jgi:hypothetical protein